MGENQDYIEDPSRVRSNANASTNLLQVPDIIGNLGKSPAGSPAGTPSKKKPKIPVDYTDANTILYLFCYFVRGGRNEDTIIKWANSYRHISKGDIEVAHNTYIADIMELWKNNKLENYSEDEMKEAMKHHPAKSQSSKRTQATALLSAIKYFSNDDRVVKGLVYHPEHGEKHEDILLSFHPMFGYQDCDEKLGRLEALVSNLAAIVADVKKSQASLVEENKALKQQIAGQKIKLGTQEINQISENTAQATMAEITKSNISTSNSFAALVANSGGTALNVNNPPVTNTSQPSTSNTQVRTQKSSSKPAKAKHTSANKKEDGWVTAGPTARKVIKLALGSDWDVQKLSEHAKQHETLKHYDCDFLQCSHVPGRVTVLRASCEKWPAKNFIGFDNTKLWPKGAEIRTWTGPVEDQIMESKIVKKCFRFMDKNSTEEGIKRKVEEVYNYGQESVKIDVRRIVFKNEDQNREYSNFVVVVRKTEGEGKPQDLIDRDWGHSVGVNVQEFRGKIPARESSENSRARPCWI